jgi:beta-glucosidase
VIATPKHYIGNEQETLRNSINSEISQRALQEIYDPAFKAAVDAGAGAVMCSYNRINGTYACENAQTLTDTLKVAWRFQGFVMSDWWATHSTVASADAGLDMNMPGGNLFGFPDYYGAALTAAVANGDVSMATLNGMVRRILWAMFSVGLFDRTYPNPADVASTNVSSAADNAVALRGSEQGTVLLKDDPRVLPIGSATHQIAVIGDPAGSDALYGGGGSASVNPTNPVTPVAGITSRASASGTSVTVAQGDSNYRNLQAVAPDEFTPTSGGGTGWTATYYANSTFSGTPIASENVSSLNVTSPPANVQNLPTWSVKYTATLTPTATATAEFALNAGGTASLKIGGRRVVSFTPNTGSTFTGLARLTKDQPTSFELDVTQPQCVGPFCGLFGPSAVVDLTWSPQESALWQQAVSAAKAADVAIVFASNYSAEGSDLATLDLPGDQDQLIRMVARANPRTVVVLNTSAAAFMPWLGDVSGVLEAWYPGQQYGNAIAALLFGDVNPSGHVPATFPVNASQGVAHGGSLLHPNLEFPGDGTNVLYQEGIDVGYRYYDVHGQTPLFPFGYGLSYTTFAYRGLTLHRGRHGEQIAQATITNTGRRTGAEVAQLYLSDPRSTREPPYQLKGFQRVRLAPGQSQRLTFVITPQDMSYYDQTANRWVVAAGQYAVGIGSDERDLAVNATFTTH